MHSSHPLYIFVGCENCRYTRISKSNSQKVECVKHARKDFFRFDTSYCCEEWHPCKSFMINKIKKENEFFKIENEFFK
jgi:hypothetical protein